MIEFNGFNNRPIYIERRKIVACWGHSTEQELTILSVAHEGGTEDYNVHEPLSQVLTKLSQSVEPVSIASGMDMIDCVFTLGAIQGIERTVPREGTGAPELSREDLDHRKVLAFERIRNTLRLFGERQHRRQ
jgi:hypothetical protein